uniref:Uncharacterized protein n=1 Tax=Cucumis melo TaxID=3656 RepID=A0A9I9D6P7_CUCME
MAQIFWRKMMAADNSIGESRMVPLTTTQIICRKRQQPKIVCRRWYEKLDGGRLRAVDGRGRRQRRSIGLFERDGGKKISIGCKKQQRHK